VEGLPTVSWPVSQDYNEAIQDPSTCFGDPDLRAAEPVTNALGLPLPCSGNFADVYHLSHATTGASWAVKCFTRSVPGRHERYDAISQHLRRVRLPFTVEFTYLEEGIRVRGQWYPVVKMQWVEGLLLNHFVRDNLSRPGLLDGLINLWGRMARRLREAEVAHGDLQHGNVLLVPGSKTTSLALKLIDYDGMLVPALAGKPTGEVGHPAYQHPQRLREGTSGPEVDRIPSLVIATALRCLAVGGQPLWERYDTGDNLLFRQADLRAPEKSALFGELWRLPDPLTHVLVGRLAVACQDPIDQAPPVTEFLAEDLLPMMTPEQQSRAEALLGRSGETFAVTPSAAPRAKADVPVGQPAGRFAFDDTAPVRRRRQRGPSTVLVAWIWVGVLTVALAVALPIVWSMAPPVADSPNGAGAHGGPTKDRKKAPATTGGETPRAKPPRHTGRATDPVPTEREVHVP
jgi:hypothetical protein